MVRRRATSALVAALAAGALLAAPAVAATPGELTGIGAATGAELDGASDVAISPDGANAYVAARTSAAVAILDRDPATGALTRKAGTAGCISDDGSGGACADGAGLAGARAVTVSGDGRNVYVAAAGGSIAVFDRDAATGALTQKAGTAGCISDDGTGGACADGRALANGQDVAVSPDGRTVYAATAGGLAVLDRDTATGALTQRAGAAGCVSTTGSGGACLSDVRLVSTVTSVVVSPDDSSVYATSSASVVGFDRNTVDGAIAPMSGAGGCATGNPVLQCHVAAGLAASVVGVAVSPDGLNVYAAVQTAAITGTLVALDRDPASGALTPKVGTQSCLSVSDASCRAGRGLAGATSVVVSADGRSVYVGSRASAAVAVLDRNPRGGMLVQKSGDAGCVASGGGEGCRSADDMSETIGVAVSPDGGNVYSAAHGNSAVVAFEREALPVCQNLRRSVFAATPRTLELSCADANGDPIALAIVAAPAHGALAAIDHGAGTVAYTPAPGFSGLDSFTYRATAAGSDSNVATVLVEVLPAGAQGPAGSSGPAGPRGAAGAFRTRLLVALFDTTIRVQRGRAFSLRYIATGRARATLTILRGRHRVARVRKQAHVGRNRIKVGRRAAHRLKGRSYRVELTLMAADGQRASERGRLKVRGPR